MHAELIRILNKHNLIAINKKKEQVIIQSFSEESLRNIHEQYSDILLVQLMKEPKQEDLDKVAEYARGVGQKHANMDKQFVEDAHARGLLVHPYTANSE